MQGMVPGTVVLTCEPCLAFLRTPSGSFRAGIPGRMVPSWFWRASRRIVMAVFFYESQSKMGSESEAVLGSGFLSGGRAEAAGT